MGKLSSWNQNVPFRRNIKIPEILPNMLPSLSPSSDSLPASSIMLPESTLPSSDWTLDISASVPVFGNLDDLPRELLVYKSGEYLSPEAKRRASNQDLEFTRIPLKFSNDKKTERQQLIRYTESLLERGFPLRATDDHLYVCEDNIWKPLTTNQLWKYLRSSYLGPDIDVESFTIYEVNDLYRRLVTNSSIHFDERHGPPMDSIEKIINLEDICFHVITMHAIPQDPSYFFTTKLNISKRDLEEVDAPYFEEFIQSSLMGDKTLRQLLLEILGTLLSNYRPKNIFIFCGASNSGKSVIVDFLRWIIGVPAITQIAHLRDFSSRWTIGNLKGKKLLICTECSDESIGPDACAVIKTITGEPTLTGEQKHKDATTFTNTTRLLLVSNHLVRLDRVDAGFANRLVTLPFPCSIPFEQQDPDLLQHLLEEKGAIFNMAMQTLNELVSRNFEYTKANPAYLEQIGDQKLYIAENFDTGVKQFVEDCCTLEADAYLTSSTLYKSYREFAETQHLPFYTKSDVFCKALHRLFPALVSKKKYVSGKQTRGVEGISLTNISSATLPKENISYE